MKNLIIIVLLFSCLISNSQELEKDTTAVNRFKFEAGIVVPMGNFKEKIGTSQIYSFNYSTRIVKNDIFLIYT